jgi:hypothetical protein
MTCELKSSIGRKQKKKFDTIPTVRSHTKIKGPASGTDAANEIKEYVK